MFTGSCPIGMDVDSCFVTIMGPVERCACAHLKFSSRNDSSNYLLEGRRNDGDLAVVSSRLICLPGDHQFHLPCTRFRTDTAFRDVVWPPGVDVV